MGMGTFGCTATIVTEDFIKSLPTAGPALIHFKQLLEKHEIEESFLCYPKFGDEFRQELEMELDDDSETAQTITSALDAVYQCFEKDTNGLTLEVDYHDVNEEGDRYDTVDGVFWSVGGVYCMTPQADAIKEHLTDVSYTKWG